MFRSQSASVDWRRTILVSIGILVFGALLYFAGLLYNPPGFFIDESSIAFNAISISEVGRDEHGESFPLFFRAFGEYKNPVYIYLLAGLFHLTGPGILTARYLSATLGLSTILFLGLLAIQISGRVMVGWLVSLLAMLTPWLFELSRLVMEVTLYPLAITLLLLSVWRASKKLRWGWIEVSTLSATLALLTYGYSIGRLLAPLLAFSLIVFVTRERVRGMLITWVVFGLTLIPLAIFQRRHPGALSRRFESITYVTPQNNWFHIAKDFVGHYLHNLSPLRLFISESSKVSEIVHIPGAPAMLTITLLLIAASIVILIKQRRVDSWWCFVILGLFISVVPASLTNEYFHMLRLAPLPIFLVTLTVPAFQWLTDRPSRLKRWTLLAVILVVVGQGLVFQWHYHASADSPQRRHIFDADYPTKILPAALRQGHGEPICLADHVGRPGYIQAFWYAVIEGIPLKNFVVLLPETPVEDGRVVITTEDIHPRCQVIAQSEPYTTCLVEGAPRVPQQLADDGFRSEIAVADPLPVLHSGAQYTIKVSVKNTSSEIWWAQERSASPLQIYLGNHWLDQNGNPIIKDDGRGPLSQDLSPGQTIIIPLMISAPRKPGEYLLELDMLQEGVSWFGTKGSRTWQAHVMVTD